MTSASICGVASQSDACQYMIHDLRACNKKWSISAKQNLNRGKVSGRKHNNTIRSAAKLNVQSLKEVKWSHQDSQPDASNKKKCERSGPLCD